MGAGGHGREVADIARALEQRDGLDLVGFVDDDPSSTGRRIDGMPVLGTFDWFSSPAAREVRVVSAVGRTEQAAQIVAQARALGLDFVSLVSPTATVSPAARIGSGTVVFPGAVVGPGVVLGDHVIVNAGASVSHDCIVGDLANINPGARIAGAVNIGEATYVGMGASVIQGKTIGSGATIGAGAVVIEDVPPNATVVGVPARVIRVKGDRWWGVAEGVRDGDGAP